MKNKRFLTSVLVLGLLISVAAGVSVAQEGPVQTEMGTAFTYQGSLTDAGGPVTGTCDFTFKLYNAASGGGLLGTETVKGVAVRDGLFTVQLDFGAEPFQGKARWLEISVDCGAGATTLSPRQGLTPAPYALYAASGPYKTGTGLSMADHTIALCPSYRLPQGCSENQIPKWDGNAWVCTKDRAGGAFWRLRGNDGTTAGTDFVGTTDDEPLELHVNSDRALRIEPNVESPNLIGGHEGNSATVGVVGASISGGGKSGETNRVTGDYATIGGGKNNTAHGPHSTICGGRQNSASWESDTIGEATVGGGAENDAKGRLSTIAGGHGNRASTTYDTVGGGSHNTASGYKSTVGGGGANKASGESATVGGGEENTANGLATTVGGGQGNTANGERSTVGGGWNNTASWTQSTVAGGRGNSAQSHYASVGGGISNTAEYVGSVGGGQENTAGGQFSTVPGGRSAYASVYGQMSYASGRFSSRGDAQFSLYVLRIETSTEAQLFLDGVAEQLTVAEGRTLTYDLQVAARSDGGLSYGCSGWGIVENDSGNITLVADNLSCSGQSGTGTWSVDVDEDDTNEALIIKVQHTGDARIRWVATVRTSEVAW